MGKMKIGIFGGSFDPIHNSHTKLVNEVLKSDILDEIWIVPTFKHPFGKKLAPYQERIKMIKKCFKDPRVKVSDVESRLTGKSFTINMIRQLKKEEPSAKFSLIMGTDHDFDKWFGFDDLIKEINFIFYKREGCSIVTKHNLDILKTIEIKVDNISSSDIRDKIKNNHEFEELVPREVSKYIKARGFYK